MTNNLRPGERLDDLQLGGLELIQNPSKFCFGVDAVFRIGGDEFLVICIQIDENTLIKRITELKKLMNERSVNMAAGVIWSENVITGFDEMLREAEEKMYADKARYYKEKGIERRKGRA